jgi:two-component system, chemotaxis family, chemotaxis protein CheY
MKNEKILIVEDSSVTRAMIKEILIEDGYSNIEEAVDGEEGVNKAKEKNYNLVITDINMPKKTGIEVIEELRKKSFYLKTPLMILTTERTEKMKEMGRKAGATGWITKPINPNQFIKAVNTVLKN